MQNDRMKTSNEGKSPIEVVLIFKDGFENSWKRNEKNTLTFDDLKQLLENPRNCYFQKLENSEGKKKSSVHRIFIEIGEEKAIELKVKLHQYEEDKFTKLNSYSVIKCKENIFIQPPYKDVVQAECQFRITFLNNDGTDSKDFIALYTQVDALDIPTVDVNKEKDKKIWENYVKALKRLLKRKENNIWKIRNIQSKPGKKCIITISKDELNNKFLEDIKKCFSSKELRSCAVNGDEAFIEFDKYRILTDDELSELKKIASEYFFEFSSETPINEISGELKFKYSEDSLKEEIYDQIRQKLSDEYGFDNVQIRSSGKIEEIQDNEFNYVEQCLKDNFLGIVDLKKNCDTVVKINVKQKNSLLSKDEIRSKLKNCGWEKAKHSIKDGKLVIDVPDSRKKIDLFSDYGFSLKRTIYRYYRPDNNDKNNSLVEIRGLEIVGHEYHTEQSFTFKEKCKEIKEKNNDSIDWKVSTRYVYELGQNPEKQKKILRKIKFESGLIMDFENSAITITATSASDYQEQIERIKKIIPNIESSEDAAIELENKQYEPSLFVSVDSSFENSYREKIIGTIENNIRKENLHVEYRPNNKYSNVSFRYKFDSEEERNNFEKKILGECSRYESYLTCSFKNQLGCTRYEFSKNNLESEREKGIRKDTDFIFLTETELNSLKNEIEKKGDDSRFKGGTKIGKLLGRKGDELTFAIDKPFDDFLNKSSNKTTVENGYIKPIFIGELVQIDRMIKAMNKVTTQGEKNGYPVNMNLPNFLFDPNSVRPSYRDLEEEKKRILSNLNEPLLVNQPKQLEAVAKALIATDMALIQGPPGTGKTTVIAEIIWQTLLQNPEAKILITSQTHLAVDNALGRLRGKKMVRPIRIGSVENFEDEGKMYSLDRIELWRDAKTNSEIEVNNRDNAVNDWINNIIERCAKDTEYSDVLEKWKKGLKEHKDVKSRFFDKYSKHVNVFAATCSECGSKRFEDAYKSIFSKREENPGDITFDVVIMDEASKATPPELVLPLTYGKKVIIIGDHKQLPPMLNEKEFGEALEAIGAKDLIENWERQDYKISQFEKLFVNAPKSIVASLDTQFRMHAQIMNSISQFYKDQKELENGLQCGIEKRMDLPDFSNKASRWHGLELMPLIKPEYHAIWVNVETPEKKVGTSYINEGEVDAVKTILSILSTAKGFKEYMDAFKKDDDREIGIITYYMPQMNKIKKSIYKGEKKNFEQQKSENEFKIPFRINTVDRFQGMERNIIIISTVRSNIQENEKGERCKNDNYPFALGFAREPQRINVGFSRAKRLLIVVGNEKHFSNKPEYKEAIKDWHKLDIKQLKNLYKQLKKSN